VLNNPVTINYNIAGNAGNGTDYALLPGMVDIPAGSKSVDIDIVVIDDGFVEAIETVTLTLTSVMPGSDPCPDRCYARQPCRYGGSHAGFGNHHQR
jgi:hypothetical protein